jgi:molecular chaperone GrpE
MTNPSDTPNEPTANGQPAETEQATAPAEAVGDPLHELDSLRTENAELKDRVLRVLAEMDNMRKRLEKEKIDAHKYAVSKFARDVVTVGDNFQRAIAAVPPLAVEQTPELKSFMDGVAMTERELLNALERHGIKRIDPVGEAFNPHMHQAVMEAEKADVPSGTVVQVFQPGYMIEDRVLRPAMVVVAKGGTKTSRPAEPVLQPANDEGADMDPLAPDGEPGPENI